MIPENYTPDNLDATHPPSIVEMARCLARSVAIARAWRMWGVMAISPGRLRSEVDETWRDHVGTAIDALDFLARNGVQGSPMTSLLADAEVSRAAIEAENTIIGMGMS